MRNTKSWFVLSLVLFSCLGFLIVKEAAADTAQSEATKAIQAAYNRKDAAAAQKDIEGYWATRTENFVWISKDGRRKNAATLKAETAQLLRVAISISGQTVVRKVTLKGNTATVLISDSGTIVLPARGGGKNVMQVSGTNSDTWVKLNGQWLQSQGKSLTATIIMNGQRVKY